MLLEKLISIFKHRHITPKQAEKHSRITLINQERGTLPYIPYFFPVIPDIFYELIHSKICDCSECGKRYKEAYVRLTKYSECPQDV